MATPNRTHAALTVIIPTAGRKASLRETLAELATRTGSDVAEVVVVDNAPQPDLGEADVSLPGLGDVRLLREPRPGKAFALNRAIETGVGEIVAVLDDDMTPMPGWIDAVIASVRARPQFDIFSGRSHVVWPSGVDEPVWAGHWLARGIAFSVLDWGPTDREMGVGNVSEPSGNHFWFRREVLSSVPAFPDFWPPENPFIATARARGHRGVFVPEVACGHRVQPELVDARVFLERAERFGRAQAHFKPPGTPRTSGGWAPSRWDRGRWFAGRLLWTLRAHRSRFQSQACGVPGRAMAKLRIGYCDELLRRNRDGSAHEAAASPGVLRTS